MALRAARCRRYAQALRGDEGRLHPLKFNPWRRALQAGEVGEVDGLLGLVRLPEREQVLPLAAVDTGQLCGLCAAQASRALPRLERSGRAYHRRLWAFGHRVEVAHRAAEAVQPRAAVIREISNETALKKLRGGRYGEFGVAIVNRDLGNAMLTQLPNR